ncbi:MAG: microcin ABC transporter ATP-binding protein [Pseudomonas fluorescens]|nr:MAG: microcin ABC transporter ATP-binding protein [Pseudomonas fluorescens]
MSKSSAKASTQSVVTKPAKGPLLHVENLSVATESKTLVKSVSFSLSKGETLAVVGESGSGKTLTALSVMGLLPNGLTAQAKTMKLNGTDLQSLSPRQRRQLRGKRMAMIFQEPATALNPVLTCGYQVEEAFLIHSPKMSKKQRKARVLELFTQVKLPNPENIFNAYPHQISGGQRQRVMIAMALAHGPELLVADEPTTALDVTVQAEIIKLVKSLQKELGMAMLWITHDFGVVKELADNVVVMQNGAVVEEGPAKTVLSKPQHAYTKALLSATLSLNTEPLATKGKAAPILTAESLTHTYPARGGWIFGKGQGHHALDNVGFTLNAGQTLGVVGESGSGKSTLARVLTRLIENKTQQGTIVFQGENLLKLKGEALRQSRKNMQMVFQDPVTSLNPKITVGQSILEGVIAHNTVPANQREAYVQDLLKEVGLPEDAATRLPHQFSGGQRQRIAIARALALKPKLVIADEPVSALDVSVQAQILKLLTKIQQTHGTAFVFISHDLRVISHLAHNVLVMHNGKVVESGPTQTLFAKPKHPYTQKLLSAVI